MKKESWCKGRGKEFSKKGEGNKKGKYNRKEGLLVLLISFIR